MRYRITNTMKRSWVIYDVHGRARLIQPGQHADMELNDGGAEYVWERALAGKGPRIEKLTSEPAEAPFQERIEEVKAEPEAEPKPKRKARGRPRKQQQQPTAEVW